MAKGSKTDKEAKAAAKAARKQASKERRTQLWQAFQIQRKEDKALLPWMIGALVASIVVFFVIGLIFGLVSLYKAVSGGSLLAPIFMNPLVSILPRILIGPATTYAYRGLEKLTKKHALSIGGGAVAGTLINTAGVMGFIYMLYARQYAEAIGVDPATVGYTILGICATNGIPECIVAVVISVAVCLAVRGIGRRRK